MSKGLESTGLQAEWTGPNSSYGAKRGLKVYEAL